LVMNTSATEIGRSTRIGMAAAVAITTWPKGGTCITKSRTAKAPAAERRFRCHRLSPWDSCPST
jgi:hypothetical protein